MKKALFAALCCLLVFSACKKTETEVKVTGVSVSPATLSLVEGDSEQLRATVSPSGAANKTVSWTSSAAAIATVDNTGKVTAVSAGTATITVKTADGGKTATCAVTVNSAIPAYEAVDLGLSVKWANKNLGAEFPEDAGDYYAWGELETKPVYSWNSYKFLTAEGGYISKYTMDAWEAATVDYLTLLEEEDDVAHKILGDKWRLPTPAEWNELHNHTNRQNSQNGMYAKASNGNSIFLPYGGMYYSNDGAELYLKGSEGFYWTSSLGNSNSSAHCAWLARGGINMSIYIVRSAGLAIRAVYGERPPEPTIIAVKLNKTEASRYAGGVVDLKANVIPAGATNKDVTWSSSNEGVATVDANGRVTVLAEGETTITVTTTDGGFTDQCKLTVNPIPDGAVFSADAFNSSTGEEPLLILQQDLSNSTVYIRKSSGTIDFNGHTVKYLYMQNNDPDKVVGLCNGIISGRLDGDAGWYRYTGQTFHGKVMMEDMEVYKEFYTDGHVYTLNSGYYETVCTFRVGDALGDVYIYGGSFGELFDVNPDAGSNQGDIFLFGGKFAIDPRTYTNAGTTNPSGNTRFIVGEGYSVKDNTEEDKDEFPYIVSKD